MFTGLVEETGRIESLISTREGIELAVSVKLCGRGLKPGDSLAVNGCCLTVAKLAKGGRGRIAKFDVLRETWKRTNLQFAKAGSLLNLERPLRADGRLGGHFVTGHVDVIGRVERGERSGADHVLDIDATEQVMR